LRLTVIGAAVLAHSLRDAGTKKKLAVLITLDTLSADTVSQLKTLYDYLIPVDRIRTPSPANLYLMGRPDLSYAFTKIALWRQTQFRKIVYLDADVVALRALNELFDIDAPFAAAPDIGWPDAFNSGVMVISPDMGEYWALQTMAATGDSFDGADQGLLNQYFEHRPWQRLKFTYNCTPNAEYQWEPAYRHYKRDISAVHFIGKDKPWSSARSSAPGVYGELLGRWWQVHDRHLRKEASGTVEPQAQLGTQSTEATATTTEPPISAPDEKAEDIDQGMTDQRKFSAPVMEWDATRSGPPSQSRPEAANFPTAQYTFSGSRQLFKAPQAYPEPPKDMWYKVPENRPRSAEKPKPIFPWEQQSDRPRATRVFAEDNPPEPTPAPGVTSPTHTFSTVHYDESERDSDGMNERVKSLNLTSPLKSADQGWQAFQQSSGNAWDSIPGIESYVRAIMDSQGGSRQTKAQILQQTTGTEELGSPSWNRKLRRESLVLTDFPTAVERPSLPVTPAPIRRPTFWGEEQSEMAMLPAAKGVPDQTEWVRLRCQFSSVNAFGFHRVREPFASPSRAVALPSLTAIFTALPECTCIERTSSEVEASAFSEEEASTSSSFGPLVKVHLRVHEAAYH
jgi:glycogenin glucosyltransferase